MKPLEQAALQEAQAAMNELSTYIAGMEPTIRETLPAGDPAVVEFIRLRDAGSAARVKYETIRSERASAEPFIRFQESMERQKDELISLPEARMRMAEVNYLNALMGEHEALSMLMVQGPQVLEQYDAALANLNQWRQEYTDAKESHSKAPNAIVSPMSMQHEAPPQPTLDDFVGGDDSEE